MNVGVIGAGLMGSTHARLLARAIPGASVVAICDPGRRRWRTSWGSPTVHADALELIADPAVDAVVVASPAATHEPYALACIAAGKPVLCEKPLGDLGGGRAADRRGRARRRAPPGHGRLHAPLRPGLRRPEGPPRRR